MVCQFCGREGTNRSISQHIVRCKNNPDKIVLDRKGEKNPKFGKKGCNQFTKAKSEGKIVKISDETRNKLGSANRGRMQSDNERAKRSLVMKKAVKEHPDSYSASNLNGRTKKILYNGIVLDGSWEYEVAKWLDKNSISWTKDVKGFEYEWHGKRTYFPDFYLPDLDIYVEVKGFERERDRIKWKVVENIVILKRKEILKIMNNILPAELF